MNYDCLCSWNSKNHRQYGKNHSKRYGSYDYIGLWEDYISLTDPDLAEPHAEGCGFGRERVEVRRLSACSMKMDICVRFKISRDTFSRFRNMYPSVCRAHREKEDRRISGFGKKGLYISDGESCNGNGWSFKSEDAVVDNFLRPATDLSRGLPGLRSFCTNTKAMMSGHGCCRWLKRHLDPSKKCNSPISQAVTSF